MVKSRHFWKVVLQAGIVGGMVCFLAIHLVILYSNNYFSAFYLLTYFLPLLFMAMASVRFRNKYAGGLLSFGQSFRINLTTGFLIVIVTSLAVFIVYSYMNPYALEARIHLIQEAIAQKGNGQNTNYDLQLLYKIMSPKFMALFFGIANLMLLPFLAIIIAIFAKRKFISADLADWYD